MYTILTPANVKSIKSDLWYGDVRESLAEKHSCSIQTIHMIAQGTRHAEVPWPDGSTSGLSLKRQKLIGQARRQAKEATLNSMSARVKALLKELEQA